MCSSDLCAEHPDFAEVGAVGGWWNRTGDVEVDLVGADRGPVAKRVSFVGSIKWGERGAFGRPDLDELLHLRASVPGAEQAKVVAVSRAGVDVRGLDAVFTTKELLAAWR